MVFGDRVPAGEDKAQVVAGLEADLCQQPMKFVHVESDGEAGQALLPAPGDLRRHCPAQTRPFTA
jgi:hypothetical protein